ncbi:hypothetical protein MW887_003977 [Aspergillus wentii]|nr:hypothetical protein MW887_003977 [Aspergillus wentii]
MSDSDNADENHDGAAVKYYGGDSSIGDSGKGSVHGAGVDADQKESQAQPSPIPDAPVLVDYGAEKDADREIVPTSSSLSPSQSQSPSAKLEMTNEMVGKYVRSIMDYHDNTTLSRLACPAHIGRRYDHLREDPSYGASSRIKYFFALDLYQSAAILPRLMGSIVEVIRFLGPERCAVSVIEGRSEDGTYEILAALKKEVESLGSRFYLDRSSINPKSDGVNRIAALAELRNMALAPLTPAHRDSGLYLPDAIIIFVNDISLCAEDILELVHQHVTQSAHMTCAFDWLYAGTLFYDVWVSRTLVGNLFFEIPQDGSWDYRDTLFFDDPDSKRRYDAFQPVQVYACWGGMITIDAGPFATGSLKFRASDEDECYMGEPTLLAKDLWRQGLGKIMAVPAVNVAYSDEEATGTKTNRGYVGDRVDLMSIDQEERYKWQDEPPGLVKCLPSFNRPSWVKPV